MNLGFKKIAVWLGAACLLGSTVRTHAFALLGPYEPWMLETNGMRQPEYTPDTQIILVFYYGAYMPEPEDIGGPMDIGSGYRWNVPVITYGFDKSFQDYFGTNGVAAVKSAIKALNDLPPASSIVLTNFPVSTLQFNYEAQVFSGPLNNLKSQTLSLLLEQLGLAQPPRYVFVLKQWDSSLRPSKPYHYSSEYDWGSWAIPEFIVRRNFDPETLTPSSYVNEILFSAFIYTDDVNNLMVPFYVDQETIPHPTVADLNLESGWFYTGLTRDDVGGLRYLLSTNTVNYETLLPGVQGVGANANAFVNGAWRPGVDKITFVPQPVDSLSGAFLAYTNQFTDRYLTNGVLVQQAVARVPAKPDILFCVADLGSQTPTPVVNCTGTTNWINNASLNGNPTGAGPGVIQPAITITFNKTSRGIQHDSYIADESVYENTAQWGTFDGSTNALITYPIAKTGTNQLTVRMWLTAGNSLPQPFEWSPAGPIGTPFAFQTSTNLSNWITSFVVTNDGNVCTFLNYNPSSPARFYRLIPAVQ
jgi:hypothetical protein